MDIYSEKKAMKDLNSLYAEAVYGKPKSAGQELASREKKDDAAGAPKKMIVTRADKKANTPAYQNYKKGVKGYAAADHLKNEEYAELIASIQEKKSDKDYDGDGECETPEAEYKGSKDKAIKKAIKKESYSDWRQDLKEIPNYDQIPVDSKDRNKKIEEKKVKNSVKINPTMEEETQVDEGVYEKQKTKEVMGALKKRDLKKDVKKKIAADIVKKKGDTSKSDDRYAYEDKTWEDIADELNESDIADIIARLEKKRISKGGNPDDSPLPSMKKYHADKKKKAGK